jgi:D-glycero-D-manno-heptose 1,7-bisphosphate phosphatase
MKKALFLDRDGVINVDTKYLHKIEDVVFVDGIFDLCRDAQKKGYCIIVVTNQAGVAKGYFTEQDVIDLHTWMKGQFAQHAITITAFYHCPYHKDGVVERYRKDADCRKPKPGMFLQAAREHDIDIAASVMVGDKNSDRINLDGLKCVVIKSRYCEDSYDCLTLSDVKNVL